MLALGAKDHDKDLFGGMGHLGGRDEHVLGEKGAKSHPEYFLGAKSHVYEQKGLKEAKELKEPQREKELKRPKGVKGHVG